MPGEALAVQKIVRGAAQNLGSSTLARFVFWVANIALMRSIATEDFGYVGLAISLLIIVVSLRTFGLNLALIHQYRRVEVLAPTHFALNTGLGVLSTIALTGLALFVVPGWYGDTVTSVLLVFALFDLVRNAATTSETQLQHELRFGRLAVANSTATAVAAGVALTAVHAGWGIWSLVLGLYVHSISYVVTYCGVVWAGRPPPLARLREVDWGEGQGLMGFGFWIWVSSVMVALTLQFDKLVVGSFVSAAAVGIYIQAHMFAQIPTGAVAHAVGGVTGTVYARYQDDPIRLSSAYRRTLRLIVRASVPMCLVLTVEAPALIATLAGDRWLPIVPVLRWLIIYMLCRPILDDARVLLSAVGRPKTIAGIAALQAGALLVLAPVLTLSRGLLGAAIAADIVALLGTAMAVLAARRHVDLPWIRAFGPPVLAALAAVAARLSLDGSLAGISDVASLALGSGILCAVYAAVLLAIERTELFEESRRLWLAFTRGTPPLPDGRVDAS